MSKRKKIQAGDKVKFVGKMSDYPYPVEEVESGDEGVVFETGKDKDNIPYAVVYFEKYEVKPALWQSDLRLL